MQAFEQLEQEWANFNGVSGIAACSSGTAALHLALESLHLPLGSRVIVPTFTMVACAIAVRMAGLEPVFVDCSDDLLLDCELLLSALPARAIMPVHIYGRQCDMGRITAFARRHKLLVVEDLAEAHGLKPVGDAAAWSFYKNKIVAGEEGGAVWCRDLPYARCLRNMGHIADYKHVPRGHNYRMSNAHAQLALDSLHSFFDNVRKRRTEESTYNRLLPRGWQMPPRYSPWVYDVVASPAMVAPLLAVGVEARRAFYPLHLQPEFAHCQHVGGEVALHAYDNMFYLPLFNAAEATKQCLQLKA